MPIPATTAKGFASRYTTKLEKGGFTLYLIEAVKIDLDRLKTEIVAVGEKYLRAYIWGEEGNSMGFDTKKRGESLGVGVVCVGYSLEVAFIQSQWPFSFI